MFEDHPKELLTDPLGKFITDFITTVKHMNPDVGHIMVVYSNTEDGNTVGAGSIQGVKDINTCVELLENYTETLKQSIPTLN